MRRFIQLVDVEFPYFLYFLDLDPQLGQTFLWTACLLPLISVEQQSSKVTTGVDFIALVHLLVKRMQAIEEFCDQILDDSTPIIISILKTQPEQVAAAIRTLVRTLDSQDNEEQLRRTQEAEQVRLAQEAEHARLVEESRRRRDLQRQRALEDPTQGI